MEPIKKAPPYDSVALLKLLINMNTIAALVVAALTKSALFRRRQWSVSSRLADAHAGHRRRPLPPLWTDATTTDEGQNVCHSLDLQITVYMNSAKQCCDYLRMKPERSILDGTHAVKLIHDKPQITQIFKLLLRRLSCPRCDLTNKPF